MPIYEYDCLKCREAFEVLVRSSSQEISCPKCGAVEVTKQLSLFGMSGVEKPVTSTPGGGGCTSCKGGSCSSC